LLRHPDTQFCCQVYLLTTCFCLWSPGLVSLTLITENVQFQRQSNPGWIYIPSPCSCT
jgi:hypothetical protein